MASSSVSSAAAPTLPPLPGGDGAGAGDAGGDSAAAGSSPGAAPAEDGDGAHADGGGAPYYWQVPNREPNPVELVTHNLHWLTFQLLGGVEYVGEVFSEIFGLVNTRYAWAVEADRNRVVSSRARARARIPLSLFVSVAR